jgi:hypothetical protein
VCIRKKERKRKREREKERERPNPFWFMYKRELDSFYNETVQREAGHIDL